MTSTLYRITYWMLHASDEEFYANKLKVLAQAELDLKDCHCCCILCHRTKKYVALINDLAYYLKYKETRVISQYTDCMEYSTQSLRDLYICCLCVPRIEYFLTHENLLKFIKRYLF